MPLPTIPAPITTHFAVAGNLLIFLFLVLVVVVYNDLRIDASKPST
ncbi:unannotated protein [freshwater metagenome]|uniref:Unannotated protein n=1 Tax=freshwater metagenome TaxID=449393 RepID=A0A6J7DIK0_9ZZZZ